MKRQRGRGGQRKPGGHQPNRALESNGPDVKVRGPAAHIYERYMQLARDANSSGDRVQAENYLQHAEHYFRVFRAMQPVAPPPQLDRFGDDLDLDGVEDDGDGMDDSDGRGDYAQQSDQPRQDRRDYGQRGDYQPRERRDYQPRGEYQSREPREPREQREPRPDYQQRERGESQPREARADYQDQEQAPREPRTEGGEAEGFEADGPRRGRRGRRNRFRPEGGARNGEGGGQDEGPVEGFGGSAPAFVANE